MKTAETLEKEAIRAAGCEDWQQAIRYNQAIIRLSPKNISALNRLAWAYAEVGKIKQAKTTYKRVLTFDKYNLIANKNLARLTIIQEKQPIRKIPLKKVSSLFLEEAGKTKVISLVRLASPKTLANLSCGELVKLDVKKRFISVRSDNNRYLGTLPDDVSFRLLRLIKGGNKYRAWIKGVDKDNLQIFIRELRRGKKYKDVTSFPTLGVDYSPYLSPKKIYEERPEMTPTGEEEPTEEDQQDWR
ncbi:MAG TPA: tetratricopeptide repeat protein [Candidatus Bathyarchaeia archaeon]|nr:tetratricopeptide repeat protein [Candidatus Bathyarchaeia archaeon]